MNFAPSFYKSTIWFCCGNHNKILIFPIIFCLHFAIASSDLIVKNTTVIYCLNFFSILFLQSAFNISYLHRSKDKCHTSVTEEELDWIVWENHNKIINFQNRKVLSYSITNTILLLRQSDFCISYNLYQSKNKCHTSVIKEELDWIVWQLCPSSFCLVWTQHWLVWFGGGFESGAIWRYLDDDPFLLWPGAWFWLGHNIFWGIGLARWWRGLLMWCEELGEE